MKILAAAFLGISLQQPAPPACPAPVVWNPLWSENPHGIGGRVGDRRHLTAADRLAVLEAQLSDPYRHPLFDSELHREIARAKREKTKEAK